MKGLLTLPLETKHSIFKTMCSEEDCTEKSTKYSLILNMGGMPFGFFIPLCEKHAEKITTAGINQEIDITDWHDLCVRAVDTWGDYVPRPQSKAAIVLAEMKNAIRVYQRR